MSWKNAVKSGAAPTVDEKVSYPFIQWINRGAQLDPRAPRGGFGQPVEEMEAAGDYPTSAEMRELVLRSGATVPMMFSHNVRAAVVATRFAWILNGRRVSTYVDGARSKLQAVAIIEGSEGPFVAMLTFRGLAGKEFSESHKAHRDRVRQATRAAGTEAPASIFYATYVAGEPKMVGSGAQSQITPVALSDEAFDLDADYVGDDALALLDRDGLEEWRHAWDNAGPNGEGEVPQSEDATAEQAEALVQALDVAVPENSKGYATVGDMFNAGDKAALDLMGEWAGKNGMPDVAEACETAKNALDASDEEEIPF